ncbi:ABC transporter ATP-binding protein [Fodinicurvata halophila]|uniref:ABC transporter ATP-binding protein n=1 Tax=Fodinicurvata halophila TaxID=1419723 RepID=A0ABV8UGM9_9PROT
MSGFEVEKLCALYGRKQVLFEVTLPALADGEILGILGPNASGKSTMIRCLAREMPASGTVRLDGRDQSAIGRDDWYAKVATMPQMPPAPSALLPTELMWSTARALNLEFSDRELAAHIEAIFLRLGLDELALSPLQTLSGGKRQLVGFALTLIRDPELMLLDEPTSALDLYWRMIVLDLVRDRLTEHGGIAIAALHDLDLAARYCDRLVLLEEGRVLAAGTPREVLTAANLAQLYRVEAEVSDDAEGRLRIHVVRPLSG